MVRSSFLFRCRTFFLTYIDRFLLVTLNVAAGFSSLVSIRGASITYPDVFTGLHVVAAVLMIITFVDTRVLPLAMAITAGTFVGRALSIWTAILTNTAEVIPNETLALAGVQWVVLAWLIRPSTLQAADLKEVAEELACERRAHVG